MSVTQRSSGASGLNSYKRLFGDTIVRCPRARVSYVNLYPGTFYESPYSVDSALLLAIPLIQFDIVSTINTSQFQPELHNLCC